MADSVSLLTEARAAGLTVKLEDDKLVVRGPRTAGPIVGRLKAASAAVVSLLQAVEPGELIAVWWDDTNFASSTPIRHLPPRECITPRACSRLGPCDRHPAGNPCLVTW